MERYDKYKDSGVEWIGQIPAGWEVVRIRHLFDVIPGATPASSNPQYWDGDIPWITPADFTTEQRYVASGRRTISQAGLSSCAATLVPAGSILVSNRAPIGLVSIAGKSLSTNQGCKALVKHCTNTSTEYYYWLLSVMDEELNALGRGTTFLELSNVSLANCQVPLPSELEQRAIADYLDAKTAQIDALVAAVEKSIDLLEEYRKSVISEAVTKGLDPKAPMKDSGVEWIGKIPEGWEVRPSKTLFTESKTTRYPGDIRCAATQQYGIIPQEEYARLVGSRVVQADKNLDAWKHVEPGDFIISLRSFQGGIEYCQTTGCVTWHYIVLKPQGSVFDSYYRYLLKSANYVLALQRTCTYIRDGQDLRYSNFIQVPLPLPPLSEQHAIAAYLTERTAAIDALVAQKRALLDQLREYRKSIVSEAVTGKLKVSGVD